MRRFRHASFSSPRSAFSLVELLVAVAVAAIVGATALALILQSFGIWEDGLTRTGEIQAADDFDLDFARDFASAFYACGLQGDKDVCAFLTLRRTSADNLELCRVKYAFDADGATAERWQHGMDTEAPGLITRYRTKAFSSFSYGETNVADNLWQLTWACSTGMPSVISVKCDLHPSPPSTPSTLQPFNSSMSSTHPSHRLYQRRTTP